MAYDSSTDPLGDGSLLESYRFEDSLDNEQGTRTFSNTGTFIGGKFGKGREVPEDSSSATTGSPFSSGDKSISFWLNCSALYSGGIDVGSRWGSDWLGGWTYSTSDDYVNLLVGVAGDYAYGGFSVTDGWHLISIVYTDADTTARIYVDDDEKLSKVASSAPTTSSSSDINIAQYDTDKPTQIDQIMCFDKALTVSDIQDLMAMTEEPSPDVTVLAEPLGTMSMCNIPYAIVNYTASNNTDLNLDPLGNGRLHGSYNFNDSLNSIQGVLPFTTSDTYSFVAGRIDNGVELYDTAQLSTSGSYFDGNDVSHTVSFFAYIKDQTHTFDFDIGGNVRIYSDFVNSAAGKQQLHFNIRGYDYYLSDYTYDGWYHFVYTWDACSGEISLQIDDIYTLKYSRSPDLTSSMVITLNAQESSTTCIIDQLMFFNDCILSDDQVLALRNDMIKDTGTPVTVTPTPLTLTTSIQQPVIGTSNTSSVDTLQLTIDTFDVEKAGNPDAESSLIQPDPLTASITANDATVEIVYHWVVVEPTTAQLSITPHDVNIYLPIGTEGDADNVLDILHDGSCKHYWNYQLNLDDQGESVVTDEDSDAVFVEGRYGYAVQDYSYQKHSFSDLGATFTVTGWFYAPAGESPKIFKAIDSNDDEFSITWSDGNEDWYIYISGTYYTGGVDVLTDQWVFFRFETSVDGWKFYQNDTLTIDNPTGLSHELVSIYPANTSTAKVDDLRVFNKLLTDSEITHVRDSEELVRTVIIPDALSMSITLYTAAAFEKNVFYHFDVTETIKPDAITLFDIKDEVESYTFNSFTIRDEIETPEIPRNTVSELDIWQGIEFDYAEVDNFGEMDVPPPIARWKLDGDLTDELGYRDLTPKGDEMFVDNDEVGICLYGDWVNDYGRYPFTEIEASDFIISFWVKPNGVNGDLYEGDFADYKFTQVVNSYPNSMTFSKSGKFTYAGGTVELPMIRKNRFNHYIFYSCDGFGMVYWNGKRMFGSHTAYGSAKMNELLTSHCGWIKDIQIRSGKFDNHIVKEIYTKALHEITGFRQTTFQYKEVTGIDQFQIANGFAYCKMGMADNFYMVAANQDDYKKVVQNLPQLYPELQTRHRWAFANSLADTVSNNDFEVVSGRVIYRVGDNGRKCITTDPESTLHIRTKLPVNTKDHFGIMFKFKTMIDDGETAPNTEYKIMTLGEDVTVIPYAQMNGSLGGLNIFEYSNEYTDGNTYHNCIMTANLRTTDDSCYYHNTVKYDESQYTKENWNKQNVKYNRQTWYETPNSYDRYFDIYLTNEGVVQMEMYEIVIFDNQFMPKSKLKAALDQSYNTPFEPMTQLVMEHKTVSVVDKLYVTSDVCGDLPKIYKPDMVSDVFGDDSCVFALKGSMDDQLILNTEDGIIVQSKETSVPYPYHGGVAVPKAAALIYNDRSAANWKFNQNYRLNLDYDTNGRGRSYSFQFKYTGVERKYNYDSNAYFENNVLFAVMYKAETESDDVTVDKYDEGRVSGWFSAGISVEEVNDRLYFRLEGETIVRAEPKTVGSIALSKAKQFTTYVVNMTPEGRVSMYADNQLVFDVSVGGYLKDNTYSWSYGDEGSSVCFGGYSVPGINGTWVFVSDYICGDMGRFRSFCRSLKKSEIVKVTFIDTADFVITGGIERTTISYFPISHGMDKGFVGEADYYSLDRFGDGSQICLFNSNVNDAKPISLYKRTKFNSLFSHSMTENINITTTYPNGDSYFKGVDGNKWWASYDEAWGFYSLGQSIDTDEFSITWSQKQNEIVCELAGRGSDEEDNVKLMGIGFASWQGETELNAGIYTPDKHNIKWERNGLTFAASIFNYELHFDGVEYESYNKWQWFTLTRKKSNTGYIYTLYVNDKKYTVETNMQIIEGRVVETELYSFVHPRSVIIPTTYDNDRVYGNVLTGTIRIFNRALSDDEAFGLYKDRPANVQFHYFDMKQNVVDDQEIFIDNLIVQDFDHPYYKLVSATNYPYVFYDLNAKLWTFNNTLNSTEGTTKIPYDEQIKIIPNGHVFVDGEFGRAVKYKGGGHLWLFDSPFEYYDTGYALSLTFSNGGYTDEQSIIALGRMTDASNEDKVFDPNYNLRCNLTGNVLTIQFAIRDDSRVEVDVSDPDAMNHLLCIFGKTEVNDPNAWDSYRSMCYIYLNGVEVFADYVTATEYNYNPLDAMAIGSTGEIGECDPYGYIRTDVYMKPSYAIIDQVRLLSRSDITDAVGLLQHETFPPAPFYLSNNVEETKKDTYAIINQNVEQTHLNTFDIIQSFKNVLEFHRFNITQDIDMDKRSVIIRRVE